MHTIKVNNGNKIIIEENKNGMEIITTDKHNGIENSYNIPDYEIIMLLNYYRNCKSGRDKSDYISEGKVINSNINGKVEYL